MDLTTLFKITYGIYIVSSKSGGKCNGCIVNSIFQVTAQDPTIAISVAKANLTHDYIMESRIFAISILEKDTPLQQIGDFGFKSGKDTDKFTGYSCKTGNSGASIVTNHSLGFIEAEVINAVDVGTHTVFIGKITEAQNLKDGEPLTYAYYHYVKGGKSSKNAPTYAQQSAEDEAKKDAKASSPKYVCEVCGYIYNPDAGDPDSGIAPGTPFEDIPDDWICPICGVGKDQFKKLED